MRYSGPLDIGDVIVTREKGWPWADLIRLGAAISGQPPLCNHVIIVHHVDDAGRLWGVEGRPGGVGERELTGVGNPASWPLTNANNDQPKTEIQRFLVADLCHKALGRPYDWAAIGEDVREALGLWWTPQTTGEWSSGQTPVHMVCSSLADLAYEKAGLANPGGGDRTRFTTPGEWDRFMIRKEWR
jgi:hypothetical protein